MLTFALTYNVPFRQTRRRLPQHTCHYFRDALLLRATWTSYRSRPTSNHSLGGECRGAAQPGERGEPIFPNLITLPAGSTSTSAITSAAATPCLPYLSTSSSGATSSCTITFCDSYSTSSRVCEARGTGACWKSLSCIPRGSREPLRVPGWKCWGKRHVSSSCSCSGSSSRYTR